MMYLQSLWNLLNLRKAILLTEHGQDPFDELDDSFKESIKQDDINNLISKCYFKEEYIFNILELMYKLINQQLIASNQNEDDKISNEINLEDILNELIDEENAHNDKVYFKKFNLEDIKLKHVYHMWKLLVGIYSEKKNF